MGAALPSQVVKEKFHQRVVRLPRDRSSLTTPVFLEYWSYIC
jgi:hypothetical protein